MSNKNKINPKDMKFVACKQKTYLKLEEQQVVIADV